MHNKYINVYMHKRDNRHYMAMMRNYIVGKNGILVYAEFVGQESDVKTILNNISDHNGASVVMDGGESIKITRESRYKTSTEKLKKGYFGLIYNVDILKGKDASVLLGKNNQIIDLFKKWLQESQPLPYPRGYYDELLGDAEDALFDELIKKNFIKTLHKDTDTIKAYQLNTELKNDESHIMQEAILKVVKQCGLLEVDRLRKMLKENAPQIGESDPIAAKVWATMRNNDRDIVYYVIEYDRSSDNVFCLVKKDNEILWEEHNLEKIFFNASIGLLKKEEFQNIVVNVDGNISKSA